MPVTPPSNLPPESQVWGRNVDSRLDQGLLNDESIGLSIENLRLGTNSALERMGKQIQDLTEVVTAQAALTADLASQQASLNAAVADLSSRISLSSTIATFNTGTLPNDASDHFYGPSIPILINVPTGKLLVTIGCGQATVAAGSGSVIAEATFEIPGVVNYYDVYSRFINNNGSFLAGGPLAVTRSFTVTPGLYTVTGQMSAWSSGTGGSVNFASPYMTVQVTG